MSLINKILSEVTIANISKPDITKPFFELEPDTKKIAFYKNFAFYKDNSEDEYYMVQNDEVVVYFELKFENQNNYNLPYFNYIGVNPNHTGKGISLIAYDYCIQKYGGMWCDTSQSKGDMKTWVKLSKQYPVYAYNLKTKKFSNVVDKGDRLESVDPKTKIYSGAGNRLIILDKKLNLTETVLKELEINPKFQDNFGNEILEFIPTDLREKIKRKFSVIEQIGAGGNGVAFLTSDGKVVKITDQKEEVSFANSNRKEGKKHFVHIYNIIHLPVQREYNKEFYVQNLYIIVMDHVRVLDMKERQLIMYFAQRTSKVNGIYVPPTDINVRRQIERLSEENKQFYNQYLELKNELKNGFDLHAGNLGWDKNNVLVAFDTLCYETNTKDIEVFNESLLKEVGELTFSYPVKRTSFSFVEDGDNEGIGEFEYKFKGKWGILYRVSLFYDSKTRGYILGFDTPMMTDTYETEAQEPLKIFSTVFNILKAHLKQLLPAPILIKGLPKKNEELTSETKRDRIYKNLAKKLAQTIGYSFQNLDEEGLMLKPINKTQVINEHYTTDFISNKFLKKIKTKFKVIKKLAEGGHGVAYLTKDNKVLKITDSFNEAQYAENAIKKNLKHFVKVYSVHKINVSFDDDLEDDYKKTLFLILMEYLKPLSQDELTLASKLIRIIDSSQSAQQAILKNLPQNEQLFFNKLLELHNELTPYFDLHEENLGWRGDTLVAFDLENIKDRFDINKIAEFKENLLIEARAPSKGCVMLEVEFDEIKDIHKQIKKEDLYIEEGKDSFGLEKETHITLLYGFFKSVTNDQVKEIIDSCSFPDEIIVHNVSLFESDNYDVLKFDIKGKGLHKINKILTKLPYSNDYPKYHPHLTIAYIKKGKGKEYVKMFKDKEYTITPSKCIYSTAEKEKYSIKINTKKKVLKEVVQTSLPSASSNFLYHVTNVKNLDDLKYGLLPQFGDTLKQSYGQHYDFDKKYTDDEEYQQVDFEGILFFSESPLLGFSQYMQTNFKIEEAVLCIVEKNDSIYHKISDYSSFENAEGKNVTTINYISVYNFPIFIETGDWFSFEEQEIIDILYGERLIVFMKKNFPQELNRLNSK